MASIEKVIFFFLIFLTTTKFSMSKTYKVGDSAGWTIIGNVSYSSWTSAKTFHVGDTVVFEYNKQFHNVLQVTRANYRSCNASSPLATYKSGKDSIPIKRKGHHFFICGVPGHCDLGQKVDIRVIKHPSSLSPSPSTSPSSSSSTPFSTISPPPPAPPSSMVPVKNDAPSSSLEMSFFGFGNVALALVMGAISTVFVI